MAKPKSPCINCTTDRYEACHDTCAKRAEYLSITKPKSNNPNKKNHPRSVTGRVKYQRKYDSFATKNELYK